MLVGGLCGHLNSQTLKLFDIHSGKHHRSVCLAALELGQLPHCQISSRVGGRADGERDQHLIGVQPGISASQIQGLETLYGFNGSGRDHVQFIIQTTESCREIISSLVDLYISNNDLRMNAIMKRLTIVSTIFIPLTFLAGIWGMNFKMMPELDWQYGYGIAWSLMLLTAISTWLYMRKKDWF